MAKSPAKPAAKSAPTTAKSKPAPAPVAKPAVKTISKPAPEAVAAPVPAPPPAPKPLLRTTGLSPKQQKLQAMLAKAAHKSSGAKPAPGASAQAFSAKTSFAGKKTAFQRKAV